MTFSSSQGIHLLFLYYFVLHVIVLFDWDRWSGAGLFLCSAYCVKEHCAHLKHYVNNLGKLQQSMELLPEELCFTRGV